MIKKKSIAVSGKDKDILRQLGEEYANIATIPQQKERAQLWKDVNDLKSQRPVVWINEVPWHEMDVNNELSLKCISPWARDIEDTLRKTIYQWRHMPGDMVVNPWFECKKIIHSTGFGIQEETDIAKTDEANDIVSRHFKIQIRDPEDIEKIQMPRVFYDEDSTTYSYEMMNEILGDILPVRCKGQSHIWFTPWDYLVRWWGVTESMMDLVLRPDMVHAAVERMVQAWMRELDQLEAMGLLSLDNDNTRVGSGGYGYCSDLPGATFDESNVKARNMWGCSNAQIFSEVSPEMHWEFALEHDMKWLARWGLTYYGCCEPLAGKVDLLRRIPNLRKVSCSPWNDTKRAIEEIGADYVMSRKPNPAVFASSHWNPEEARRQIREFLDEADGQCHIELIMKDISTVNYEPQRLWEWEAIAMDEVTK